MSKKTKTEKIKKESMHGGATREFNIIEADIDISVKFGKTEKKDEFSCIMSGKSIDAGISNAIRRTVMLYIPVYGINRNNCKIENGKLGKKTIYNNDMISGILEQLPLFDIDNRFDINNPENYLPTSVMKNMFSTFVKEKYFDISSTEEPEMDKKLKGLKNIRVMMNIKNDGDSNMYVNTHHLSLEIDGMSSDNYKKRDPVMLFTTRPGESLSFEATANLGIEAIHASYEATTLAYHIEIDENTYDLRYTTLGQLSNMEIFKKACKILIKKLENFHDFIEKEYKTEPDSIIKPIEISLYGEDGTLANIIANALKKCNNVERAGFTTPHYLEKTMLLGYTLKSSSKDYPFKTLKNAIKYLIKIYETILSQAK